MKRIILSVLMFTAVASTSFAIGGGFEFILNVPIGMSIGIYDYDLTDYAENLDIIQNGTIRENLKKFRNWF